MPETTWGEVARKQLWSYFLEGVSLSSGEGGGACSLIFLRGVPTLKMLCLQEVLGPVFSQWFLSLLLNNILIMLLVACILSKACELFFTLQRKETLWGGNARKMWTNHEIPHPHSDPPKWGEQQKRLKILRNYNSLKHSLQLFPNFGGQSAGGSFEIFPHFRSLGSGGFPGPSIRGKKTRKVRHRTGCGRCSTSASQSTGTNPWCQSHTSTPPQSRFSYLPLALKTL